MYVYIYIYTRDRYAYVCIHILAVLKELCFHKDCGGARDDEKRLGFGV